MRAGDTPFDSIEGAYEYVSLLGDVVEDAMVEVEHDSTSVLGSSRSAQRQMDALRLAHHKLTQLRGHLSSSRRILNDLRTLRRLMQGERREAH
jgi:hypothetical protein